MPSETRWLNAQERQAWRNLSLMQLQLDALLGRELAAEGLSYQDYLVMADLSERDGEQARMSELGHHLGWEKSRLSHHISRMEKRGLVAKVKCPTDKRGWFVCLTDNGRQAISQAAPEHVESVRRNFIDLLTSDQLEALDEIANIVLDHLPEE
ncbi:MAG: MarR family transcriptional regulator [Acidimicrobiales bacterium]|nr:MarR family transcriptional regulator [Acidimicrobiales bacterium]RZV46051.1 MAG: MarR family transcriptional regulator [Acidimicrobiales bacterium]